jgi:hypothetical protein
MSPTKVSTMTDLFNEEGSCINLFRAGKFDECLSTNDSPMKNNSNSEHMENEIPDNFQFDKRSPFFGLDEDQVMIPVTK